MFQFTSSHKAQTSEVTLTFVTIGDDVWSLLSGRNNNKLHYSHDILFKAVGSFRHRGAKLVKVDFFTKEELKLQLR